MHAYISHYLNLESCVRSYYKYKEKLVILQSIEIIVIKSKETRVITYTPADILVGIKTVNLLIFPSVCLLIYK